ncbi:MAG TPA: nucleotidyltransferase family protein [Nitrospiria bacterium]|nr:nucleotidyltransferase family protein [Nitrospiria bacterium]
MKPVSAILLAAGKGSRAGGFKPLLPWNGESFLSKVFRSMKEAGLFGEIVVVTGFRSDRIEAELRAIGADAAFNPEFEKGMHRSIRRGLRALRPGWSGALIAHVDQPQLEPSDYAKIVRAFQNSARSLARPCFEGRPGTPAILGFEHLEEIEAEPDADRGCAYLFERHPRDVLSVEMDNPNCTKDFDAYP